MTDTEQVLKAVQDLKELLQAQIAATIEKTEMMREEDARHAKQIEQLYGLDRDRGTEMAAIAQDLAPVKAHVKNSNKMTAAFVVATIGVLGVAFGERIVAMFKGGPG